MRYSLLLLTPIFLLISCTTEDDNATASPDFTLEEPTLTSIDDYGVLNAILNTFHSDSLQIYQKTEAYQGIEDEIVVRALIRRIESYGEMIDTTLLQNYVESNDDFYLLDEERLSPFTLISENEFNYLFRRQSGWESYYNRYENSTGYLQFYKPGFNTEKNVAFVEYIWSWDYLGAKAYAVNLEKVDNQWIVVKRTLTWVS